jgi:hypothetical protein
LPANLACLERPSAAIWVRLKARPIDALQPVLGYEAMGRIEG